MREMTLMRPHDNQTGASVRLLLWTGIFVALLAMAATSAGAAPGDLDPTFGGGDGMVATDFGGEERARAVAVQSDGKIVVAGGDEDFELARYTKDGTLDTGFGGDGKVTTDFGDDDESARAVVVQPNGKVVAAGKSGSLFVLARYNADGTPDTSFGGGDGVVTTDFPDTDTDAANALVLQPNGKLVAAGVAWPDINSPRRIALARYEDDGSLDTGFGEDEDGLVVTSFPPKSEGDVANALLRRPNGKLIAVGIVHDYPNGIGKGNVGLVQYNADGSLDTGFGGGDGMASERSVTQATSAALAADGQIVVAGGWENFLTDRFNSDGSVDTGYDGMRAIFPGWHGTGRLALAVQVQSDGRVVAAGGINDDVTGVDDFAVARFDTEGRTRRIVRRRRHGHHRLRRGHRFGAGHGPAARWQDRRRRGDQRRLRRRSATRAANRAPPPRPAGESGATGTGRDSPGDTADPRKSRAHRHHHARKRALRKCRKLKSKEARRSA